MTELLKIKKIISAFICILLVSSLFAVTVFAEDNEVLKLFDFENIEQISDYPEFSATSNGSKGVSSEVKDGVFTVGKHTQQGQTAATHTMYIDFSQYIGEKTSYSVKLDLMPKFAAGKNFMVRCGANFQLVCKASGKYVIQCMKDGKFVTENQTEFAFADENTGLAFATDDKKKVNLYYVKNGDLTLVYGDVEYIENSSTKAGTLGFTFNKSSDGDIAMDNITILDGIVKPAEPDPGEPENDITRLEFEYIGSEIFADKGEEVNIPFIAEAASGIEKAEVYVDGELYQTLDGAPYIAALKDINRENVTVTVKVQSVNGSEGEISANVNFADVKNAYTVFEDSDFADGEAGMLKSGISMYQRRGTIKKETVDLPHGTSLFVGADIPDTSYAAADIPYIDIPLKSVSGRVNAEFDLYIDKKDSSGRKTLTLRLTNDKEANIVRFTNSDMKLLNKLVVPYESGEWYHFSLKADTVKNTVSVFVNGVPYLTNETINSSNADGKCGLKILRLYGPSDENAGFTVIDNIKVTGFYDLPSITECREENGKIYAKLSANVFASSINKDTVCLKNANGKNVELKDVYYDSSLISVVITPMRKLVSSSDYTVEIFENAQIADGVYFGETVEYRFKSAANIVALKNADISLTGEVLKGEASVENVSDGEVTVFAVMTLFDDTKCVSMRIEKITLAAGETKTALLQAEKQNADCAQIYIYSDVMASKLLSDIFKKNF